MPDGDDGDKDAIIKRLQTDLADAKGKLREAEKTIGGLQRDEAAHAKALEDAKAAGIAEATEQLRAEHARTLAGARLEARAARKGFLNPTDASKFIDAAELVDKAGNVADDKALDEKLDTLATERPYFVGRSNGGGTPPPPPPGSGDGGPRPIARPTGTAANDATMNDAVRGLLKH